jgi:hypothetical protein
MPERRIVSRPQDEVRRRRDRHSSRHQLLLGEPSGIRPATGFAVCQDLGTSPLTLARGDGADVVESRKVTPVREVDTDRSQPRRGEPPTRSHRATRPCVAAREVAAPEDQHRRPRSRLRLAHHVVPRGGRGGWSTKRCHNRNRRRKLGRSAKPLQECRPHPHQLQHPAPPLRGSRRRRRRSALRHVPGLRCDAGAEDRRVMSLPVGVRRSPARTRLLVRRT